MAGLRTILCHVEPGLKNENWFLHPDLYFFAQYWVGPFNRNVRYQGAEYVKGLIEGLLPVAWSYGEDKLSEHLTHLAGLPGK